MNVFETVIILVENVYCFHINFTKDIKILKIAEWLQLHQMLHSPHVSAGGWLFFFVIPFKNKTSHN